MCKQNLSRQPKLDTCPQAQVQRRLCIHILLATTDVAQYTLEKQPSNSARSEKDRKQWGTRGTKKGHYNIGLEMQLFHLSLAGHSHSLS